MSSTTELRRMREHLYRRAEHARDQEKLSQDEYVDLRWKITVVFVDLEHRLGGRHD